MKKKIGSAMNYFMILGMLCFYKLVIRWIPFRVIISKGKKIEEMSHWNPDLWSLGRVVYLNRAIQRVSRVFSICGFKCFEKALTVKTILGLWNIGCTIHFGIKKNHQGAVKAHAWSVSEGIVVTGNESMKEFTQVYCVKF